MEEHIRFIKLLNESEKYYKLIVCFGGEPTSYYNIVYLDKATESFRLLYPKSTIPFLDVLQIDKEITFARDLVLKPSSSNMLMTAGANKKLYYFDINAQKLKRVISLSSECASLLWDETNGASLTLDSGELMFLDWRAPDSEVVKCSHQFDHKDLWTHKWLSNNALLCGFGNGLITQVTDILHKKDKKQVDIVQRVDPFVGEISDIHINSSKTAFVASGLNDFSVWRLRENQAKWWSHHIMI